MFMHFAAMDATMFTVKWQTYAFFIALPNIIGLIPNGE